MSVKDLLVHAGTFAGAGLLGWVLENAFFAKDGPRYSKLFGEKKIPFLPVYAVGGLAVGVLAPHLQDQTLAVRATTYGLSLTALEWGSCQLERKVLDRRSWDYQGGCVDLPHSLAWAALGLAVEHVLPERRSP